MTPSSNSNKRKFTRAEFLRLAAGAGAALAYHAKKWHVHVASAFPLAHHYRAVFGYG